MDASIESEQVMIEALQQYINKNNLTLRTEDLEYTGIQIHYSEAN